MRKDDGFITNCSGPSQGGCTTAEPLKAVGECAIQAPAQSTMQPLNKRRTALRAGRTVACLVGLLLLALMVLGAPATASAQMSVGIAVSFGPPALPVYVQPSCPAPGYIWTPGYWAWDPAYGYYWVPGTWVPAPFIGALWTPGYWAYDNGGYVWYAGYWGPVVGYYGGINYGYGYPGYGYYGGYWNRNRFYYNRAVNRITIRSITTVYTQRVVDRGERSYVSYHGGPGGTTLGPTAGELAAARQRRFGAVSQQVQHERFARTDPALRATANHGRPDIAATARPGVFRGGGIERATRAGAPYNQPPRTMQGGRETARPAPDRAPSPRVYERAPATSAPRNTEPRMRMENTAPARQNAPARVERSPRQAQPPQARRTQQGHPQGRQARPEHQERNNGGNGHERQGHPPR